MFSKDSSISDEVKKQSKIVYGFIKKLQTNKQRRENYKQDKNGEEI